MWAFWFSLTVKWRLRTRVKRYKAARQTPCPFCSSPAQQKPPCLRAVHEDLRFKAWAIQLVFCILAQGSASERFWHFLQLHFCSDPPVTQGTQLEEHLGSGTMLALAHSCFNLPSWIGPSQQVTSCPLLNVLQHSAWLSKNVFCIFWEAGRYPIGSSREYWRKLTWHAA